MDAPPRRWLFVLAVALVAVLFALHAGLAARQHSPSYDETFHTMAAWLTVNEGDFRLTPDHPPLSRYVAGLPLIGFPMTVDLGQPRALAILSVIDQQAHWAVDTMYRVAGNDGLAMVSRARLAMTFFPLVMALTVAAFARAMISSLTAGRAAAIFAAVLLSLDPNLLAHGGLVADDIAASCVFALAGYLTWRLGNRFDGRNVALLALTCAIGVGVKMNCLLLAPMIGLPLLYRSFDAEPWLLRARAVRNRFTRVGMTLGFSGIAALVAIVLLWVPYGFRYAPTAPGLLFDERPAREKAAVQTIVAADEAAGLPYLPEKIPERLATFRPGLADRMLYAASDHHLIPQAWAFGLTYARASTQLRWSYLDGTYSSVGFKSYFICAVLYKTPVTTLVLGAACLAWSVWYLRRTGLNPSRRWKLVCMVVPPTIYLGVSIASNLNIGLRHILPIYPFVYVGFGVAMGTALRALDARWQVGAAVMSGAIALVAVETLMVFPNYISFFNLPSGGARGGLRLLGDSNLDWGQDLDDLADWYRDFRAKNPNEPFYLSYFGSVPPEAYGIEAINAPPGFDYARTPPTRDLNGGVFAVSATHLQGIYAPLLRDAMAAFRARKPLATINDTIYIYRMSRTPPASAATQPTGANR